MRRARLNSARHPVADFLSKLGRKRYNKGIRTELKVFNILRNHGFVVFRHPHSATPDLLAWRRGVLYLIAVKSTSKSVLIVDPEQLRVLTGMLDFYQHTTIPALAFIVVYFSEYGDFGSRRINPLDRWVMVRYGDHADEIPF